MARSYIAATKYENQPEQVKHREERNRARAAVEKKLGHKLPHGVDVDHVKPLGAGGSNAEANTRVLPASKNRAWRKGSKKYIVKGV